MPPLTPEHPPGSQRPLIIERPDLQTAGQRFGYLSLTFVCWIFWLYLFVPLLSLVAWVLGARTVYEVLLQDLSVSNLVEISTLYGTGIGALTLIYLVWAVSSYLRFRRVDRRAPQAPVSAAQLAASHQLSLESLSTLQSSRRMVIPEQDLILLFGFTTSEPASGAADLPTSEPASDDADAAEQHKDQAA